MPRVKKTEINKDVSTNKKKEKKAKPKAKTSSKNKAGKKTITSKSKITKEKTSKAKPIIVDVIDDDLENETFFSDESLETNDSNLDQAKDFFLNLEENETAETAEENSEIIDVYEEENSEKERELNQDTDKQKQFFSDLVAEIREKKEVEKNVDKRSKTSSKNKKSIRLYRSLAWKFLILVGFLAVLVFYFSFSKLTILITPEVEAMNDTLFLKIANQSDSETRPGDARTQVEGSVNELGVEIDKTYQASGEEYIGEEIIGTVKIVNNYSRSQALVASTRLLSSDNKLFRIKDSVNVPAGGEVEVEIYADKVSREMAIPPTRFIIPGLWVGLQDSIYAESEQAFTYTQKMQKYVKASDIQLAKSEAYDLILANAKERTPSIDEQEVLYKTLEPIDMTLEVEVGDKIDEFSIKVKATVVVIAISKTEVENLANTKLKVRVPDDKELSEFNPNSLMYVLEGYDEDNDVAKVKATFSGFMILRSDANVIDKESLVNLKQGQIQTYLKDYPSINNFELEFYPSFIERAPHLIDRIEVKIKK